MVKLPPTNAPKEVISTSTETHDPEIIAGLLPSLKLISSPLAPASVALPAQSTNFMLKTLPITLVSSVKKSKCKFVNEEASILLFSKLIP